MDEMVKRRLAGALVLGSMAAITLPWLFGSPKDPRSSIQASFAGTPLPAPPASPLARARPTPEPGPRTSPRDVRPAAALTPAPRPSAAPVARPTVAPTPRPTLAPTPRPTLAPTPRPAAPSTPAPPASGWVLQLASYRDAQAAEAFIQRLRKDGYQAFSESAVIGGRSYHRVRMGLSMSREEAELLQRRLEQRYRLKAQLFAAR